MELIFIPPLKIVILFLVGPKSRWGTPLDGSLPKKKFFYKPGLLPRRLIGYVSQQQVYSS